MFRRINDLKNWQVLGILFVLFAGGSLWSLYINLTSDHANFAEWGESWLQNFSTEMSGAFVTFILIELIVGGREKRDDEKARLIRQMRSSVNNVVVRAVEELREHGWLEDGSLQRTRFFPADWQDIDLSYADLQGADLGGAFLQKTNLKFATLRNAQLIYSSIENTNLEYADLYRTNLGSSFIIGTNLKHANLESARLKFVAFDENTTLPDDTKWTRNTDMTRFTDPNHPQFWRSDDPRSPAYRGKVEE